MADPYVVDVTLALDTSQYASGDVLAIPQEVKGAFPDKGIARKLVSVQVLDEDDQNQVLDLAFFSANATLGTINGAVNISDADMRLMIGYVVIASGDSNDTINSRVFYKNGINQIMQPAYGSNSLWVGAICRGGTPTYTASGIRLKLGFE